MARADHPAPVRERRGQRDALAKCAGRRQPEAGQTLAKEYLEWQTMRIRQLLDFLQQQVAIKAADKNVIEANENEILTLADFPLALVKIAGLTNHLTAPTATVAWNDAADEKQKSGAVAAWRDEVESGLPNLLTPRTSAGCSGCSPVA